MPLPTTAECRGGVQSFCGLLSDTVTQVFGYILVPKFLIIENFRLGVLCRFLQFCAVCLVVTQILVQKQWIYYAEPSGDVYYLAGRFGQTQGARLDTSLPYCANIASYDYAADATGAMAVKPTECLDLPNARRAYSDATSLFVPTYVVEKQQTFNSGGVPCSSLQGTCTAAGDTFSSAGTHAEASGSTECVCENVHEYFVSKPEETYVDLQFRFEASMDDAGKLKERGSSNTQVYKPYTIDMNETPYDIKELDHEVITSLRRKGQKDATVGGHTFRSGAGQAVSIPVSSFLEAAGVGNLDLPSMYSNHKYIADTTLQSSAALRATGINLAISISCARKDVSVFETQDMNIYCDMFADSEPTWTTREDGVHDEFVSRTGSGILKTKKQHGVKLNFRFTGRLGYFSTSIFLGSLTSAIVLLELPGKAVMLLALFCLGLLSRVYYSCQSQRLNLRHQVHGFAARLINAKKSYEAIVKSDKMDTHLDRATLAKEMTESFHHLCEEKDEHGEPIADPNKPLQKEELEKMTELVYQGLDADHEGSISLDEYVDASTSNEVLRVDQIVQFFDDQRQRSCLEKLFDDAKWDIETDEELRKRRKKDLPNETPRPAHAADIFMNL